MQSLQQLQEWIEEVWPDDLTHLPSRFGQAVYHYTELVYYQLTKYGSPVPLPSLEQIEDRLPTEFLISLPGIRSMTTAPPPAPPPPIPSDAWNSTVFWIGKHQRSAYVASGIAVAGLGTAWAYRRGHVWLPGLGKRPASQRSIRLRTPSARNGSRREAIVVVGADTTLGRALALHLSTLGFVVIASVSSHSAVTAFNSIVPPSSRGYVKALRFDTADVAGSLDKFIRSVDEVLRLRFPLLSAGDPYAAPGDEVSLVGIVNALSYVVPAIEATFTFSPAFRGSPAELAEALEKHIAASLCAIASLQPLLVSAKSSPVCPASAAAEAVPYTATIISLLSSPVSHTSIPGAGIESVVSQATAAGMEVLRREIDDRVGRELSQPSRVLPAWSTVGRRRTRITTLEIDEGRPWGYAVPPSPKTFKASSDIAPTRPVASRKLSSGCSWQSRDATTQAVLAEVSSLLLTSDPCARLQPTYRIYVRAGEHQYLSRLSLWANCIVQRLMRVLPTSWVDLVLSMRRRVSIRRAGVINQGPRSSRTLSASQATLSIGPAASSLYGRGSQVGNTGTPAPASSCHSRAFINQSFTTGRGSLNRNHSSERRYFRSFSASSDDGFGEGTTSGPPSLPDSNSGESGSFHEGEDGMIPSGVWLNHSSAEGPRQQRATSSTSTDTATAPATVSASGTTLPRNASHDGPWMGPSSRNSPLLDATPSATASGTHSPLIAESQGISRDGADFDSSRNPAILGDSWVRLDDNGQRDSRGCDDGEGGQ